jgi:phosphoglycerate kinase
MLPFLTLDDRDLSGKRVLVRTDLNVPIQHGKISDTTRIRRVIPTLEQLLAKRAKVIVLSHFARPEGAFVPSMSLAPIADALAEYLPRHKVKFAVDCIGKPAEEAVAALQPGEILLLENLRFHAGEEQNDDTFAKALASLGDVYVNDAFSCSHRAHASIVGLAARMPALAGRLMQAELEALHRILEAPQHPMIAVVGGSKISSKLPLLEALLARVDRMIIGGGMANTFLAAQGHPIGNSLCERDLIPTAQAMLARAAKEGKDILLPEDVVVAKTLSAHTETEITHVADVPDTSMILDVGPFSLQAFGNAIASSQTVVWNGPVGAFEFSPFDASTIVLARMVAGLTRAGRLQSIAGGGDTAAALTHAGLSEGFTYLSTAGGAFLEWLEGKPLPGVQALFDAATDLPATAAQQK